MGAVPKPNFRRRLPKRKYRNNFSQEMKTKIREHFDYTCQECGLYDEHVHVHHIRPKGSSTGRAVFSNALCLCWKCHERVHKDPDLLHKWQRYAEEKYGRFYYMDKQDLIWRFESQMDKEIENDMQRWMMINEH